MELAERKLCGKASIAFAILMGAYLWLDPGFSPFSFMAGSCFIGAIVFLGLASSPETPSFPESPPCNSDSPRFSA